jgi:hypothetical protein
MPLQQLCISFGLALQAAERQLYGRRLSSQRFVGMPQQPKSSKEPTEGKKMHKSGCKTTVLGKEDWTVCLERSVAAK